MRLIAAGPLLFSIAVAAPQQFTSGPARTHVIELFTSEGCSSCPPAEAWLASLGAQSGLWRDFVPIAWHVDYWDGLGWKDRFASKPNTQRQYDYAAEWHGTSVYTPCLVLDGAEWHDRAVPKASTERVGLLRAAYDGQRVTIEFKPATLGTDAFEAHAVVLAMGVSSRVTAGENSGRNLRHDFVAAAPIRSAPLREGGAILPISLPAPSPDSRHALVVWICRAGQQTPLQATGGILERQN